MVNNLGTLNTQCDAPPYDFVHACAGLGFQSPLDVRWLRINYLARQYGGQSILSRIWRLLCGHVDIIEKQCTCGFRLPVPNRYRFSTVFGTELDFFLGQCGRCRTIFWQETRE
jgi:hypothetical protein